MPTINPRINITLEPDLMNRVSELAKFRNESLSSIAKELIAEAIELQEDRILSHIANSRDKSNYDIISEDDAWSE